MRLFLALVMAIELATPALAQQPGETVEQGGSYAEPWFTDPTDITRNPDDITNRLKQEAKRKDTLLRTPGLDRMMLPWTEFKDQLFDDYGLGFGIVVVLMMIIMIMMMLLVVVLVDDDGR